MIAKVKHQLIGNMYVQHMAVGKSSIAMPIWQFFLLSSYHDHAPAWRRIEISIVTRVGAMCHIVHWRSYLSELLISYSGETI
jgi:hypothetical protein